MADTEPIRLVKGMFILIILVLVFRLFKWSHKFLFFIFWKKDLLTNTYEKSAGDIFLFSLKIKFKTVNNRNLIKFCDTIVTYKESWLYQSILVGNSRMIAL